VRNKLDIKRIIISRTDSIGDVILTLPVCGLIKKYFPDTKIIFLGRTYTKAIINCCEFVDEFMNADELLSLDDTAATATLKAINADTLIHVFPNKRIAQLAKKAKIKNRIGTTNRLFHWGNVNKLVKLSRKNSTLHEAQLNCKLLCPLGINVVPNLPELANYLGFTRIPSVNNTAFQLIDPTKTNVILHPKSNASAREWSLENYSKLIQLLPSEKYKIFISGTNKEKEILSDWLKTLPPHVVDITGKFSLEEFIVFIGKTHFLVAASTGPLHIAAAIGIGAVGIYPPIKPMHPGRWRPIGKKVKVACVEKSCNDCRKNPQQCLCMGQVYPADIAKLLTN
jgi:ADP-heptose:LPS heptosyltransferase